MSSPRIDRPEDPSELPDGSTGLPGEAAEAAGGPGSGESGESGQPDQVGGGPWPGGAVEAPQPRTEPVLALLGAAAAGSGQLLTNVDALWVLLDLAAVLAAVSAIAMLLRTLAVERGQPALAELATGVVTAGMCVAVLLLALHGPEARLGSVLLDVAAGMGAVLSALIVGGASLRYLREGASEPRAVAAGIPAAARWMTVIAAAAAVVTVTSDVVLR